MSFSIKNKRSLRSTLVAVGVAGALALAMQPVSGAWYTASGDVHGVVNTGSLTVQVSPENLTYNNLVPGGNVDQNITVKNTGTVAATVHLKNNTQGGTNTSALTGADWSDLGFGVVGYTDQVIANAALNADLGVLQPGQTKVYTLRASLNGENAGNEWAGVSVNIHPQVTVTQVH